MKIVADHFKLVIIQKIFRKNKTNSKMLKLVPWSWYVALSLSGSPWWVLPYSNPRQALRQGLLFGAQNLMDSLLNDHWKALLSRLTVFVGFWPCGAVHTYVHVYAIFHFFSLLFPRACIEIIQTLGLMFRETEIESSRLNTLAAKK